MNQPGIVTFLSVKETGSEKSNPCKWLSLGALPQLESDWMEDTRADNVRHSCVYRVGCAEKWSSPPHPYRVHTSCPAIPPRIQVVSDSSLGKQRVPGIQDPTVLWPCPAFKLLDKLMVDTLMDARIYGGKVKWMGGWTGAHLTPNHMLFLYSLPPSTSLRMTSCNDKKSKKGFIFSFFFFFFSSIKVWIGGKEHGKKVQKMYRRNH